MFEIIFQTSQQPRQIPPRMTGHVHRNVLRGAHPHHHPASRAAFGPHVDQPIGGFDDVEVVLDHHDGVARIAQLVQHLQQQRDVGKVQAGGRLVEDVERAAGVAFAQFECQLHALRLAARQRRRGLAELDVGEAHVEQRVQLARDHRHGFEKFGGGLNRQVQDLRDVFALVLDFERFAVVAQAFANVAGT
jgi:hypothetical protein